MRRHIEIYHRLYAALTAAAPNRTNIVIMCILLSTLTALVTLAGLVGGITALQTKRRSWAVGFIILMLAAAIPFFIVNWFCF